MPHIGNDIVDLMIQRREQKSTDLRFLKKILTDTEIDEVRNSRDPEAALWSFWTGKEAAYKVMRKKNSAAAFVPRRFAVRYSISRNVFSDFQFPHSDYQDGEVVISDTDTVYIRLFTFSTCVHCLAADVPEAMNKIVSGIDRITNQGDDDLSDFVRQNLVRCLAANLNLPVRDMQIIRRKQGGEPGEPLLYIAGVASSIDLSISHDGCLAAYAYMV